MRADGPERRQRIRELCAAARADRRSRLSEPEGLAVAGAVGLGVPATRVVAGVEEALALDLDLFPGERVVVKAVAAGLAHKSDAGGVAIVDRRPEAVAGAVAEMASRLGPSGVDRFAVQEWIDHDRGLGGELLAGVRWTDAFGPVVVLGPGGLDAEPLSTIAFAPLVFAATPGLTPDLERLLAASRFGSLLTGPRRGRPAQWSAVELAALLERLNRFGAESCPDPIAEIEWNPIVRTARGPVALDAAARLGTPASPEAPRPPAKIDRLLNPRSIAVVGVSERENPGHLVVRSLLAGGFPKERLRIVKTGRHAMLGCSCVPSIADLRGAVDLLVLAVAAAEVPDLIEQAIDGRRAESVIVLSGGLGESAGSGDRVERIRARLARVRSGGGDGPVVHGGNCLGVRSIPGRCDTLFIPPHKLGFRTGAADPVAIVAQSGAFAIARASQVPGLSPRYLVTVGNQLDLTVGDYLEHLAGDREVEVFGVYVEGFRPDDGRRFLAAARRIVASGRPVVLYLAGRTAAGAAASASHTAAVAGDRRIAIELARQAGVLVSDSLEEFDDLVGLGWRLAGRRAAGRRLGALSNAGFECVAIADALGGFELAGLAPATRQALGEILRSERLEGLVEVRNPLDVTPIAGDETFAEAARMVLGDPGVDVGLIGCVPLTGALSTLPAGAGHAEDLTRAAAVAERLGRLWRHTTKPWVAVIDSGPLYDPLAGRLEAAGIPTFRSADRALRRLEAWSRWSRGGVVSGPPAAVDDEPPAASVE